MAVLRAFAERESLATGGYLLFADYRKGADQFLLMAMIKQRPGITIENLEPRSIQELDLSKLHQLASISFNKLEEYLAGQADKRYIRFVSPKANQAAAGYFIESIGCRPVIPPAAATGKVISETYKFFDEKGLPFQSRLNAKESLIGILQYKADSGEDVTLDEIEHCVRPYFPPGDASQLSDELRVRLQSEDIRIPVEFTPSKTALKRYTRFQYKSDDLKVDIQKSAVKFDDSSPIFFDRQSRKLIISDPDFISELGDAMNDGE